MSQFDVYARRSGHGFLVDCQADTLSRLSTRFVVPALPRENAPSLIGQLNPVLDIQDQNVVLMPQNAATVSTRELGRPIGSVAEHRYAITNAIDMLLTGY